MLTKTEIDEAIRRYGSVPTSELPYCYRNPRNERDFVIAAALQLPRIHPGAGPEYDDAGVLTGWHGIALKTPPPPDSGVVSIHCVECESVLEIDDTEESTQEVVAGLEKGGPGCYFEAQDEHGGIWQVGRLEGQWVGHCADHRHDDPAPDVPIQKIGRNEPCPCHSGLKYKRCCGKATPTDEQGFTYRASIPLTDPTKPELGTREGSIIVKVQTAMNDPSAPALIYDRGRTFQRFVDAAQVEGRLAGRVKGFFYARLSYGQLVLEDEAPAQEW